MEVATTAATIRRCRHAPRLTGLAVLVLLAITASWWLFLACFWTGCLVALIAYRASIPSAVNYAEQLKVAFDLYRNELLQQLRIPLPATAAEERASWMEVNLLLYRNVPLTRYAELSAKPGPESEQSRGS